MVVYGRRSKPLSPCPWTKRSCFVSIIYYIWLMFTLSKSSFIVLFFGLGRVRELGFMIRVFRVREGLGLGFSLSFRVM